MKLIEKSLFMGIMLIVFITAIGSAANGDYLISVFSLVILAYSLTVNYNASKKEKQNEQ